MRLRRWPGMLAIALLLGLPAAAHAHATLLRSTPAANAHLPASPDRVSLTFSEAIEPGMAHLMLQTASGRAIALDVSGDPHDVNALIATIDEQLPAGSYRIEWHVVSADGHPVQGRFDFFVGDVGASAPLPVDPEGQSAAPATWGPAVADAPVAPAILRGLALGALMALGGLLYFRTTSPGGGVTARSHLVLLLALAAPLLLAAHLTVWIVNASPDHALTSERISDALGSEPGRVELARTALGVLALWALVLARRERLTLLFTALALAVSGATGHSAALHPWIAIPMKAAHLLAGGLWMGGLLWLLSRGRRDASAHSSEAHRVSGAALIALIVVMLSGAVQSLLFLSTLLDVARTAYGAVVLAKVVGFLVLAAFGAHHRFRVLPAMRSDGGVDTAFRATLCSELAVMALVTLLGGLLAYIPPATARVASSATAHSHQM